MGVATHEGIEAPVDRVRPLLRRGVPLGKLEPLPDAEVPGLPPHGEHVRPVGEFSLPGTRHAKDEAEQLPVRAERTQADSTHPDGDPHHGHRDDIGKVPSPRLALEPDASFILLPGFDGPEFHFRRVGRSRDARGLGGCGHCVLVDAPILGGTVPRSTVGHRPVYSK